MGNRINYSAKFNDHASDAGFDFTADDECIVLRSWVSESNAIGRARYVQCCDVEYDLPTIGLDGIAA